MMSTTAPRTTTVNAVSIVMTRIGGTSRRPIESAAYWPTPCRPKTLSVRIAPPPMTAAKSRPKSAMTGIRELRRTWRSISRERPMPFARAART